MSTNQGEYDGSSIPRYAAVNFSLLSRWGDGYNQKQPPATVEETEESQTTQGRPDYTENAAPDTILTDEKMKQMDSELDNETK
jgi:hypothetical protein